MHEAAGAPGAQALAFRPLNFERWVICGATALLFIVAPLLFTQGFARTLLSQIGIMMIFALSYNMLLGQAGMLSFGHAVYSGLGAFCAIHAMNWFGLHRVAFPISLVPLIGGLAAMGFGFLFGYVTTKKSGTAFAMITLGIGEMVSACSLMFPGFFGGEGGVTGNRTAGRPLFGVAGWTLGSQLQVYCLIAVWCFACMVAMYALTQTPLGRIANAVRDNPERVEFIGYDTQIVRWLMLMISSFFAGIAGALSAINFEIVTAENVGTIASGAVLLAAFIGGAAFFFGPVLGAVTFVLFAVALSAWTKAWQFYLGIFFVLVVMFAPGGLAGMLLVNLRVAKHRRWGRLRDDYVGVLGSGGALAAGVVLLIEMTYHRSLELTTGSTVKVFGWLWDTDRAAPWVFAAALIAAAAFAFVYFRRRFVASWDQTQTEIAASLRDHPDVAV